MWCAAAAARSEERRKRGGREEKRDEEPVGATSLLLTVRFVRESVKDEEDTQEREREGMGRRARMEG